MFEAVPIIFIERRGFTLGQNGLTFIGVGIGACLGALINAFVSHRYSKLVPKFRGFPPPEERLYGAMLSGPCLFIGSLWLGWSGSYPHVHWIVPIIGMIWIGLSVSLTFVSLLSYLVDTYLWVICIRLGGHALT